MKPSSQARSSSFISDSLVLCARPHGRNAHALQRLDERQRVLLRKRDEEMTEARPRDVALLQLGQLRWLLQMRAKAGDCQCDAMLLRRIAPPSGELLLRRAPGEAREQI